MATREQLSAAAKFRAECQGCGKRSPRWATGYTVKKWMDKHEQQHREEQDDERG